MPLAVAIAKRYFRQKKVTAFNKEEWESICEPVIDNLASKFFLQHEQAKRHLNSAIYSLSFSPTQPTYLWVQGIAFAIRASWRPFQVLGGVALTSTVLRPSCLETWSEDFLSPVWSEDFGLCLLVGNGERGACNWFIVNNKYDDPPNQLDEYFSHLITPLIENKALAVDNDFKREQEREKQRLVLLFNKIPPQRKLVTPRPTFNLKLLLVPRTKNCVVCGIAFQSFGSRMSCSTLCQHINKVRTSSAYFRNRYWGDNYFRTKVLEQRKQLYAKRVIETKAAKSVLQDMGLECDSYVAVRVLRELNII